MIETARQMTTAELKAELERREASEQAERKQKRVAYERRRDQIVRDMVCQAIELNQMLSDFKADCVVTLDSFKEEADAYGEIRSNSKGGYSLRSANGNLKVSYERNTKIEYDERATTAEAVLRDFLADMVKKRDQEAYSVITTLLERGKDGKFNPAAIAALVKMEDAYNDPRWRKAIQLFKESPTTVLVGMNVSFFEKDEMNRDQAISLTFASLPVVFEDETDKKKD